MDLKQKTEVKSYGLSLPFLITGFVLSACLNSCIEIKSGYNALPPGIWRATLELDRVPFAGKDDQLSTYYEEGDIIPFLIKVIYVNPDSFYIEIINGDQLIKVDKIIYGLDRSTAKDTITLKFQNEDSYIKAIYEENIMEGFWYFNHQKEYKIPFKAYHGQKNLFTTSNPGVDADFSGCWTVTLYEEDGDTFTGTALFEQSGMNVKGTMITQKGDFGPLTGQVIRNRIYLAAFDGNHAFYLQGKMSDEQSIQGIFRAGIHYRAQWIAIHCVEK
ncbi:MAG TPA: hypothetical protein PKC30_11790 [Saprospiraceae bacterium]|nr:hypothetical protein [Saprospiraceae bacterium]